MAENSENVAIAEKDQQRSAFYDWANAFGQHV